MNKVLDELTPKQRDFVLTYIKTKNATESAKIAGYSEKTAYSQGQRLLKNVEIENAIKSIVDPLVEEQLITVKEIITELKTIGMAPESKFQYHDKFGNLRTDYGDKIASLKALGDHAGAWKPQEVKHTGEVKVINVSFE